MRHLLKKKNASYQDEKQKNKSKGELKDLSFGYDEADQVHFVILKNDNGEAYSTAPVGHLIRLRNKF